MIYFETYSIMQVLFLFGEIRKADIIYFHQSEYIFSRHKLWIKKIIKRLIYLANKRVKIEAIPNQRIYKHLWAMSKESVNFVEGMHQEIKNSASYKVILKIIQDENVLKCYKAQLVHDMSVKLSYFGIAGGLVKDYKGKVRLVPADNNTSRIQKELFGSEVLNSYLLAGSSTVNSIKNAFGKIYMRSVFLLLPLCYLIQNFRKVTFKKINKKTYDIAMPFVWGFYEGEIIRDGVKWKQEDSFLYNSQNDVGRIVHVFKNWRYAEKIEKNYKRIMDERGIPFIDSRDYRLSASLLLKIAKIQFKIIGHFLLKFFLWGDRYEHTFYSCRIINWMLVKYFELENVDYKVEFIMHDYTPHHIVETILCNTCNKKTVGMQHTASLIDLPHLCHVHFDKYIVYGDIYIKEFSPYWEKLNLAKTGRMTVDYAINILKDENVLGKLKDRMHRFYPKRKYTVVITMSSDVEWHIRSQWDEMYKGLYNLKTLNDMDFNLFLRFRRAEYLCSSENMVRFAKLPQWDERIHVDLVNFTTYELMALADIFIGCCTSFSINEAIATRAKVFTFNLLEKSKYFFKDYGNDFVLSKAEDILRVFNGLKNNFKDFDCDWELLKKCCNFHYDGRNLERIRQAVWDTVREIDEKKENYETKMDE